MFTSTEGLSSNAESLGGALPQIPRKNLKKLRFTPINATTTFGNLADFTENLVIRFSAEDKLTLCPYTLRDQLQLVTGSQVTSLTAFGLDGFSVKVATKHQSETLLATTELCSKA